jgi:4-amino-4-deoxy-L-arabinose transferase-like glycosyltransferase
MAKSRQRPPGQPAQRRALVAPREESAANGAAEDGLRKHGDAPGAARSRSLVPLLLRAEWLVVLAAIAAAILRFRQLGTIPPGLNQDEAANGYDAYSLLLTGRDHLGHAFPVAGLESLGDWASPLLTFLTVPAVGLFGLELGTIRGVAAAMGALAVPVVYWLALELFGARLLGVVAAWIIALSPWHMHLSRWAIPPAIVPTMVAATLLALVWSAKRRSARGIVVAAILAGLTIASYPTMKLYVPLLGLTVLAVYWRELLRIKWEALAYAALAILLIAGPILYLSTRDPGGRARFDQESIFKQADIEVTPGFLARQYFAYFSPKYLFQTGDNDPMHIPGRYGAEVRALAPFLVIGLAGLGYGLLRRRFSRWTAFPWLQPQVAALILLALVLVPVPGSLTKPSPLALRGAQYIPLAALLAAVGIAVVAEGLARLVAARRQVFAQGALAAVLLLPSAPELSARYRYYFGEYPDTVVWHYQYGLEEALAFARERQAEYDEIWVDRTNQPYILVLFFTRADPSTVHRELNVRRQPPHFNSVSSFGKYRFGDPFNGARATLPVLYTIARPPGQARYEVRGGMHNGRQILLVRKP